MKNLCTNYLLIRYKYCNHILNTIPVINRGEHRGAPVYRIKCDGKTKILKECLDKTAKYESIVVRREVMKMRIEAVKNALLERFKSLTAIKSASDCLVIDFNNIRPLAYHNRQFWESLKDNASTFENSNEYYCDGYNFRSRVEYWIAIALKDMGLSYKYDCEIKLNGKTYTVDFVVYLEEFECCFLIEYLGRLDDEDYLQKNMNKMKAYLKAKVYPNRNLLLLCGDNHTMPSVSDIKMAIADMVGRITENYLTVA